MAEAMTDGGPEFCAVKLQGVAFEFVEERVFLGRRRENAFVEAEHEGEFEIGIAGAINRADQNISPQNPLQSPKNVSSPLHLKA
jgi:hypothetical protein